MGATNRPFDLDSAALRRFPKRICINLPDYDTRVSLIAKLLEKQSHSLSKVQLAELAIMTDGYSGSDLTALAKDAALEPVREQVANMSLEGIKNLKPNKIRPLNLEDFKRSFLKIRQSTPKEGLEQLEKWNETYGDIRA
jgi:SpoVK/Ycf46/Vps4 family AAA+-type ATPase